MRACVQSYTVALACACVSERLCPSVYVNVRLCACDSHSAPAAPTTAAAAAGAHLSNGRRLLRPPSRNRRCSAAARTAGAGARASAMAAARASVSVGRPAGPTVSLAPRARSDTPTRPGRSSRSSAGVGGGGIETLTAAVGPPETAAAADPCCCPEGRGRWANGAAVALAPPSLGFLAGRPTSTTV